jgi:DegV family protein with EDD domain
VARVRVVTDSACDLSAELVERGRIIVVPLTIRFGAEELADRQELSPAQFWERCRAAPELPQTAAPSPGAFQAAFESAADEGADGVVCLTISSGVSATYQSALAAAEAVAPGVPVEVIDTTMLTMGQGLLCLAAAEAAAAGADLKEIGASTRELITRTRAFGVVDTLDHLQRGGRIGGAKALLGSLLSIKPVIEVRGGVVEQESRQRTRARSLQYMVDKARADAPLERLGVANGAAPDIDVIVEALSKIEVDHPLVLVDLGPVVGTHAGPGTIAVCYQLRPGTADSGSPGGAR